MVAVASPPPASTRLVGLETQVFCIPTDRPEADGTIAWDSTTLLLVEARDSRGPLRLIAGPRLPAP